MGPAPANIEEPCGDVNQQDGPCQHPGVGLPAFSLQWCAHLHLPNSTWLQPPTQTGGQETSVPAHPAPAQGTGGCIPKQGCCWKEQAHTRVQPTTSDMYVCTAHGAQRPPCCWRQDDTHTTMVIIQPACEQTGPARG